MPKILPLNFSIIFFLWMTLNTVIASEAQSRQPPFFDEANPEIPVIIDSPSDLLINKNHVGEGPVWQHPASDINFITDTGATLDTPCRFRSEGHIEIPIPITRVVGEVNENGNLIQAQKLIKLGLLSPTASLAIPIYDVDLPKEIDEVWFNGILLGHLMGGDGIWELNRFEIPIEQVKFPRRNPDGVPLAATNTIIIKIDTISTQSVWCTSVDWAALSFKTMSPIILIQNSQLDKDFFSRYNFTTVLQQQHLLFDDSINLAVDTVKGNGMALDSYLTKQIASFGVDSIHLIVHSQSGLDAREYLANYQHQHDENLTILSYTSLGTPHNGSVLADVVTHRAIAIENDRTLYSPDFMTTAIQISGLNQSISDLTTSSTAWFNLMNIPRLPTNSIINTIAADVDSNANGQMDRDQPDEYFELRAENQPLKNLDNQTAMGTNIGHQQSRLVVDVPYQLLRHTNQAKISYKYQPAATTQTQHWFAKVANISTAIPWKNDVLVTIPSAQGQDALSNHTTNTSSWEANRSKNHISIADTDVADTVMTWLIAIETSYGDLQ